MAAPTVFAQSAGAQNPPAQNPPAQTPSTQSIEEINRKLDELEKEVQTLRDSIKQLEEQQRRKQSEEQQKREAKQEPQPQSTQPAGATRASRRQRPISGVAKQETVSRDRETVARIDNQTLDPKVVGLLKILVTQMKVEFVS